MTIQKKAPIEKLTPEQEAQLPVYAKKWQDIGMSTERADRPRAEAGMRDTYKREGLPEIKFFAWNKSPLSMVMAFMCCDAVEKGVTLKQVKELCLPAFDKVEDSQRTDAFDTVLAFRGHLEATKQLPTRELDDAAALQTFNKCKSDFQWQFGYGQHDANWLAFYEYFKEVCGLVEETESLTGLWEVAKSAGWYLPYTNDAGTEGRVFFSERQTALHLDDRGRPHNTEGPFYSAADGTKAYFIAGIEIPNENWVENPSSLTVKDIEGTQNVELRRVLIDMYESEKAGRSRGAYLFDSGATLVSKDEIGELYLKKQQGDEDMVCVKVTNSTPEPDGTYKDYILRVPPTTKTPREAIAWTFGLQPEEYQPMVQT